MNKVQKAILSFAELDYESIDSIRSEVQEEIGGELNQKDFSFEVKELFHKGLLRAFRYSKSQNCYEELKEIKIKEIPYIWFLAKNESVT